MKHKQIIYLLSDYIENLLPDDQRQKLEEHLSSCKSCRSKLQELQTYHRLVSKVESHAAPEDIRTTVMQELESRRQTQDSGLKTQDSGLRTNEDRKISRHASRVTRHVILAAAAILLLFLAIPKEIFYPTTINTDVVALMQKKGKGGPVIGGVLKSKNEKRDDLQFTVYNLQFEDVRLRNILELVDDAEGEIVSAEVNITGEGYSNLMVKLKKKAYKDFAEAYNTIGMAERLPEKAPFTLSSKIYIHLFPVKRVFFVGDFNADGYDDIGLHYTSGRQEGRWFVALNNHTGSFYSPLEIELDLDTIFTGTKYIPLSGDFNGDGYDDIIIRGMKDKSNGTCFIHINKNSGNFRHGYQIMVGNSKLSFTCPNIPYTGDFNANEYDDIGVTCTGFKMPDHWFVLNNTTQGHLDHGYNILVDGNKQPFQGDYLPFTGDFNGDSFCDIGVKWLTGDKAFQYEISLNIGNEQFDTPFLFRYNNGYKAWQGNYTHYFGDFNADGLCDIMTREGDGNVLGAWYISLNQEGHGFGGTFEVVFGGSKYLTSN